ncbi:MAG: glycoside hydrolase family 3 protein, partial [Propionibacteriales bacterium]|nr:glycoside hydrolase family 3 protein [Propionibacteriales bacterium]
GLVDDPYVDVDDVDSVVGTKRSLKQAQKITDRTTTLVKNDGDLLPLAADSGQTALVTGWGVSTTQTLADKMTERGVATDVLETGINPSDATIDAAVAAADAHDVTVVLTNRASIASQAQQQILVQRLVATGKPVVAVAVRDPYDIRHYPDVPAFVATYSYFPVALDSLVRVLFGELAPKGTLPVTIPVEDDPDIVLYPFGHGLSY